uniref:Uncharacterized protein n=1 Tax=Oryza punctata TaxID=4537 RepID=A0A0E0KZF4_ORYPU
MAGVEVSVSVSVSPTKKRKAEESSPRATKRIQLPDVEKGATGAHAPPAKKKMWRLPKKEVDRILARSNEPVCARFRELKRANPSLVPSPEEEKDEYTMLLYECTRDCYEDEAKFANALGSRRREEKWAG